MNNGTKSRSDLSEERLKVIDPLGEIRSFAHQLWVDAGSPDNQDWRDYFEQAERGMTKGTGPLGSSQKVKHSPTLHEIDRRFLQSVTETTSPIVKVLADAYPQFLNRHESICLIALLDSNEIVLKNGATIRRPSPAELAEALGVLCGEYNQGFLDRHQAKTFVHVPVGVRVSYWSQEIPRLKAADEPLTYNDQNTIRRLLTEIQKSPSVKEVNFIP